MAGNNYTQGRFVPKNPQKYLGNPTNIIYRSSWELRAMIKFDHSSIIEKWGSEEIIIPYFWALENGGDGKNHRYFPDFIIHARAADGSLKKILIEIKPYAQTQKPVKTKRKRKKTMLNEEITFSKNSAKWEAALEFCKRKGWQFWIMTEKELFPNGRAW
jgi:hypothetical protein